VLLIWWCNGLGVGQVHNRHVKSSTSSVPGSAVPLSRYETTLGKYCFHTSPFDTTQERVMPSGWEGNSAVLVENNSSQPQGS